jgi:hypothetical protein
MQEKYYYYFGCWLSWIPSNIPVPTGASELLSCSVYILLPDICLSFSQTYDNVLYKHTHIVVRTSFIVQ